MLPLLQALLEAQPTSPGQPAPLALEDGLRALLPLARPGSQILALSDFAGLREEAGQPLDRRSPRTATCGSSGSPTRWRKQGLPNGRFRAGLPGRLSILDGARVRERWRQVWQRA